MRPTWLIVGSNKSNENIVALYSKALEELARVDGAVREDDLRGRCGATSDREWERVVTALIALGDCERSATTQSPSARRGDGLERRAHNAWLAMADGSEWSLRKLRDTLGCNYAQAREVVAALAAGGHIRQVEGRWTRSGVEVRGPISREGEELARKVTRVEDAVARAGRGGVLVSELARKVGLGAKSKAWGAVWEELLWRGRVTFTPDPKVSALAWKALFPELEEGRGEGGAV